MLTLALDCSQKNITLALFDDDRDLCFLDQNSDNKQSQMLLPLFDQALKQAGVQISDIKQVLFAIGPGSFTSLRIGLAFLKGVFGQANIVFQTFSSLQFRCLSMAVDAPGICCTMPLGRGRVVAGILAGPAFTEEVCSLERWQNLQIELEHKKFLICTTDETRTLSAFREILAQGICQISDIKQVELHYAIPPDIG